MSNTYMCPDDIIAMFATEEMAESFGRAAALDWANSLPCLMGDKIIMPDVGGVLVELTKLTPGVQ